MNNYIFVIITGIALANLWYWVAVLYRIIDTENGFWKWVKIWIPQGIIISWAIILWLNKLGIII